MLHRCIVASLHHCTVEILGKKMTNTLKGASHVPFHALNATISDSILSPQKGATANKYIVP